MLFAQYNSTATSRHGVRYYYRLAVQHHFVGFGLFLLGTAYWLDFSLRIVVRIAFFCVLRIEASIDHVLELEMLYFLYVLESRTGMCINTGRIAYCVSRQLSL